MLSCRELNDVATAYIEGELQPWTRMSIWMHIQMCAHCRRYFRQLRQIRSASRALPPLDMPPEVVQSMHDIFERAHAQTRPDPDE